jgi:hypothetical protein
MDFDDIMAQMLSVADNATKLDIEDKYEDEIRSLMEEAKKIEKPITKKTTSNKTYVLAPDFDKKTNLLDQEVKYDFENEIVAEATPYLTQPMLTIATLIGNFANVQMHEGEWVKALTPNKYILALCSNFGTKVYEKYTLPPKKPKTKSKKKKPDRKKQGDGTEFSSQLTFVMNVYPDLYNDIIPMNADIFKIKVFRNGKIQFPGIKDKKIVDHIIESIKCIESKCNATFNAEQSDLSKLIFITNINVFMKNYKFNILLKDNQIVNLNLFADILKSDRYTALCNAPIRVHSLKYDNSQTHLSVLFETPIYLDQDKKMLLTIEKSGKVNIKGGLYVEYSKNVFDLINNIIKYESTALINKYILKKECFNVEQTKTLDELFYDFI